MNASPQMATADFITWGCSLLDQKRPDRASVIFRQAVRLEPRNPPAWNWLGLALLATGQFDDAEACFAQALELQPCEALFHQNYGTSLKEQGRLEEALAAYDVGLKYEPLNPSIHWNRSLVLLQSGDFAQGWPLYEWRFRRSQTPSRNYGKPQWDGRTDLSRKTLLIHSEQGLGDSIQFCRFAARIKSLGAKRIMIEVQSPIYSLMAGVEGVDQLIQEGDALPEFDFHLPMMSSPAATQTTLTNLPAKIPYLNVPRDHVKYWSGKILTQSNRQKNNTRTLRIGIAWQGNPNHKLDQFRSMPLKAVVRLANLPNTQLYSLQRGPGAEQLDATFVNSLGIVELTDRTVNNADSWLETAAIIMNMDLVISVDTATAHLAGALGRTVWIALSKAPDWRWMLDRDDSPWYPTARLFRQRTLNQWDDVIQQMKDRITSLEL